MFGAKLVFVDSRNEGCLRRALRRGRVRDEGNHRDYQPPQPDSD
jgi:hypothetical protein